MRPRRHVDVPSLFDVAQVAGVESSRARPALRRHCFSCGRPVPQIERLRVLNLSNNSLKALPNDLARLRACANLDLSDNGLTALPDALVDLTALTRLQLHSNTLKLLPPQLGRLRRLEHLALHTNQLVDLPASIGQLTGLTWLSLNNNKLERVPPELFACAPRRRVGELAASARALSPHPCWRLF